MSEPQRVRCPKCGHKWLGDSIGRACPWAGCTGVLMDVDEPTPTPPAPERDALWCAIYAAEFVRRVAERNWPNEVKLKNDAEDARRLADWHHEVVAKEER